jgi:Fe-S-cluster-containing dehydrogenase component
MTQYGMLIEADRCIGCSICTRACKDEYIGKDYPGYSAAQPAPDKWFGPSEWPNQASFLRLNVQPGQNWINYSVVEKGTFPNVTAKFVYTPCMHCQNPPCVTASTNNAVSQRKDGIVLIDPVNSVDERQIVESCPYGVVYWNAASSIPQKCTFCAQLVDQGQNPKCVDMCPVSVITFGDISDPNSNVSKKIASLNAQPLHPEYGTKPSVYYSGLV